MGKFADPACLLALAALGTQQASVTHIDAAQSPQSPYTLPAGPQRAPGKR